MVVHVDGCGMDLGRDRRPPVDGVFAGFQFLDVVPVELPVRRASTPGATGFLLDGTFPWALLSHARLGSCQRSSDDFAQFAQRGNRSREVLGVVALREDASGERV